VFIQSAGSRGPSRERAGEQYDVVTGLQYLRARYYDPSLGRFNRPDPFAGVLSQPLTLHSYSQPAQPSGVRQHYVGSFTPGNDISWDVV